MSKDTTGQADVIRLRQNIQDLLRRRVLEAVQTVLEEELSEALGTRRYERSEERRGYRNGHETRRITTRLGTEDLQVPRGRIVEDDGSTQEFHSEIVPRYAPVSRSSAREICVALDLRHRVAASLRARRLDKKQALHVRLRAPARELE